MKKYILFLATLMVTVIWGSAHAQNFVQIDWANNPLYPVPYYYTPNHFRIEGKLMKLKETWKSEIDNDNDIISNDYEFNEKAVISKRTYKINDVIKSVSVFKGEFQKDRPDGYELTEYAESNQAIALRNFRFWKNNLSMVKLKTSTYYFLYDSRGYMTYQNLSGKDTIIYKYDDQGRMISQNLFNMNNSGNNFYQYYSYKKEKGKWVVEITHAYMNAPSNTRVHMFDERGNILRKEEENGDKITTYVYTFDKKKNWTTREETITRISTGYKKVNTRYRTIEYAK